MSELQVSRLPRPTHIEFLQSDQISEGHKWLERYSKLCGMEKG
jgi:hypothetical protein